MRILVIYYSRTENTKQVAAAIARSIGADAERIADTRDRDGFLGYVKCLFDQAFKLSPPLVPVRSDVTQYDIVVVGTPIWGSSCSTPIRTFLQGVKGRLKKVAFFCVYTQGSEDVTFADMADFCGTLPFVTCAVQENDVKGGNIRQTTAVFAEACRTGMTTIKKKPTED